MLPVVLGLNILSASMAVWNGYVGTESLTLPRRTGFIMLLIFVAGSALAMTFQKRKILIRQHHRVRLATNSSAWSVGPNLLLLD